MISRTTRALALAALVCLGACDDSEPTATTPDPSPDQTRLGARKGDAFLTSEALQARFTSHATGEMKALATVGDILPGSGQFLAPIPDGIGVFGGQRFLSLLMNHELSEDGVEGQFRWSRVSRFTIATESLKILDHDYVVDGSEQINRLCSAEWVDTEDGFPGGYFFTGEEVDDGRQFAIDRRGRVTELVGMGRYAHENQISAPGFPGHVVVLNFDDNGGSGEGREGAISELYMYVARSSNQVMRSQGDLYVWAADDEELLPSDVQPGGSVRGHWVHVPRDVASDFEALEAYVDEVEAFPFIRLEDGFYDKRPGASPAAYFYDTGRSSITVPGTGTPVDPWGSIYRIEFEDVSDPAGGAATLRLLARSAGPDTEWASPDNGDMNAAGEIMLQEDRANDPWNRRPGIWRFRVAADGSLVDPTGTMVVELVDPRDADDPSLVFGNESSGIVDVSEWFGPGAWIFDVQAHDTPVPRLGLSEENGQLVYMKLDRASATTVGR